MLERTRRRPGGAVRTTAVDGGRAALRGPRPSTRGWWPMALEGSRRWRPAELKGRASPRAGGARGEWSMGTTGSIPYPYPCDFTFWSLRSWRTRENSRQRIFSRHWMAPTLLFVRAYSVFLVPTAMCLTGSWLREDSVAFSCREFASVRVRQCFLTHSSRPPESTSTVRGCWFSGSDCALVSKSLGSVACAISAK